MLRVVAHKSAAAAQSYYAEGLRREDYYSEGQEVAGKWHGKAAALLGLAGKVTPEAFAALVENRHPGTGERLTARTKNDRIVGYDLNFHAPKSLSVLYALTGDDKILKAFRAAVAETMGEIEAQIATRVRQRGAQENRVTGNFAWAEFVHFTARPVGGIPDPHLHVHAFTFNATYDSEESRWKAGNFRDIKKEAPYSEAVFHSRLTDKLAALDYGIERTRQGWEVKGIPRAVIDKFSRRTAQIERLAAEKNITDAKAKDGLGAASREGKRRGMTYADLLAAWGVRLTPEEKVIISRIRFDKEPGRKGETISPQRALDEACDKLFAKSSVVQVNRLAGEALRFGVGHVTPDQVWKELGRRELVTRRKNGELLCTSIEVLAEEVNVINFVRTGRGMHAPIKGGKLSFANAALSEEQRAAVRHLLTSRDQVAAIRGGAGVGKTTLMSEAVAQIEAQGLRVFAFAPSAAASRETLREAGFANAETVAHLLNNPKLQEKIRGQVVWVDEAGLLGMRDMWKIMQLAGNNTRIILTGDTAQHAPVPRGDAFRLMQKFAGLKVAEVTQIRRQEREDYRKAVASLSKGDLRSAFRQLDELGAILEVVNPAERYQLLAQEFLTLSRKGAPPLVVSPTHAEGVTVTAAIRDAKKDAGLLGPERSFVQYHNLHWEEADRRRGENYREGLVVHFHQNVTGILRGELFRITGRSEKGEVRAVNDLGREIALPLKDAARFQVFEEREIKLAGGDQIRITRNGKSDDGRRLNNGNVFTIRKFTPQGKIVLNTGAVLDSTHGHLTYGYCQTSHSAQSRSVKDVLVAQSADSFLASSREQFYVSVSRGKQSIRIYTDDRRELQEAVGNSSTRKSAVELAGFTKEDISKMTGDLTGTQWRERVRSRAEDAGKSHVEKLLRQRQQSGTKKADVVDFRQYVAMRRGLSSADGRSRSKGHPSTPGQQRGSKTEGKSFLRPTQPSGQKRETVATKAAAKSVGAEQKPLMPSPQGRVANGYRAAKDHFKKVSARVKDGFASVKNRLAKQLPKNNEARVSKHAVKQRASDAGARAKQQTKLPQKAPAPTKGR
jgi:conjugative relaxase-like TrwC/TraI family protein